MKVEHNRLKKYQDNRTEAAIAKVTNEARKQRMREEREAAEREEKKLIRKMQDYACQLNAAAASGGSQLMTRADFQDFMRQQQEQQQLMNQMFFQLRQQQQHQQQMSLQLGQQQRLLQLQNGATGQQRLLQLQNGATGQQQLLQLQNGECSSDEETEAAVPSPVQDASSSDDEEELMERKFFALVVAAHEKFRDKEVRREIREKEKTCVQFRDFSEEPILLLYEHFDGKEVGEINPDLFDHLYAFFQIGYVERKVLSLPLFGSHPEVVAFAEAIWARKSIDDARAAWFAAAAPPPSQSASSGGESAGVSLPAIEPLRSGCLEENSSRFKLKRKAPEV
jgi:hypothetical protein